MTDMSSVASSATQRVAVAMSGGVDSSVAAAWLVDQGYEVIGLTMRLWDCEDRANGLMYRSCCGSEDVEDARRVAQTLGIAFYVVDMRQEFLRDVVNPFLQAYAGGRTPNPCMLCNQEIKFKHLLNQTQSLGIQFLATGHYAEIKWTEDQQPQLFCGQDSRKDQSYFLASTPLEMLAHLRFPLGGVSKEETRRLAKKWGLHLAEKKESQDVCFVPDGDYGTFFRRHGVVDRPGLIKGVDGKDLGRHQGIHGYTIGQRRGLGISSSRPMFVVAMDVEKNLLIVGPEDALYGQNARLNRINWLIPRVLSHQKFRVHAKIRYASPPVPATLELGSTPQQGVIYFDS
ncbi:MAG TPA: tRNA 2-thiouridine(34) synthase MnmA, partial [Magnetococcales bacterium]|nr:tRNA 2-thiouridine(34) synthase MnmA [Magnetococcales bacterium]